MNKEELKKHCEKQITLCLALNDYKHAEEHQVVLDILEQNQKYKEVIDKAIKHVSSLSSKGRDCRIYANVKKDILDILKEVE